MTSIGSLVESGIRTLKIGLTLYWEAVSSVCSAAVATLGPQCGSSLYDPENSSSTSPPVPIYGAAG